MKSSCINRTGRETKQEMVLNRKPHRTNPRTSKKCLADIGRPVWALRYLLKALHKLVYMSRFLVQLQYLATFLPQPPQLGACHWQCLHLEASENWVQRSHRKAIEHLQQIHQNSWRNHHVFTGFPDQGAGCQVMLPSMTVFR